MNTLNPSATTAVRLGPGILGAKGYAHAAHQRSYTSGAVGLGPALRGPDPSAAPEPLVPESAVAGELKRDPLRWAEVLEAESERPEGARRAVVESVLAESAAHMPADLVAGLRQMFQLEG
jgi:hypothetical protein